MLLSLSSPSAAAIVSALLGTNQPFGLAAGNYTVRLGVNQILPGSIAGWSEATFGGYAPLTTSPGWANGNDSLTGQPTLTCLSPAGGYRWVGNSSLNGTQQTIRSVRIDLNSSLGNYTLGSGNLLEPQSLSLPGDQINLGSLQIVVTPLTPV